MATVEEMRDKLVTVCDYFSAKACEDGKCLLIESCRLTRHTPRNKADAEIVEMYNDALKRGSFKEE